MGEVGRLDLDLMYAYRAEPPSKRKDYMLSQLVAQNRGLIVTLVNQLRGRTTNNYRGRRRRGGVVFGAWMLDDQDADQAGYIAFGKAMEQYDPERGTIASYLRTKIYHELQCVVSDESIAFVGRVSKDNPAPGVSYFEDDRKMDLLLRRRAELEGDDDEELEPPPAPPLPAPPAPVVRTALEELLDVHLRFAPVARVAAVTLRGRFEAVLREHQEHVAIARLLEALDQRGVRKTTLKVSWSPTPVRAFAGVGLRNDSRPPVYEVRRDFPGHP